MKLLIVLFLSLLLLRIAWWWFVDRNQPAFPPLILAVDDPLMLEAYEKAKNTLPDLRAHFPSAKEHTRVKVPFVTSSGETEHLWAELLELEPDHMVVRYMTPPVSHTGK